jgi:hypothetical protein
MAAEDYGGRKRNHGIRSGGGDGMGRRMATAAVSRTRGLSTHMCRGTIASGFFVAVSADCDVEE